ncbi:MAG: hypothetical protein IPM60_04315 [Rhodospirillales bacterium]|nr:hypothetical protein [Rhodospirillales bacterium]
MSKTNKNIENGDAIVDPWLHKARVDQRLPRVSEFFCAFQPLEQELADNAKEAAQNETEIIAAARNLSINPRPAGTGADHWRANCPQTNHSFEIQAQQNLFFCGYCSRSGGPAEPVTA